MTAGTLNTTGTLLVRARAVGAATAIARLAALVEQVQGAGSSVQRLADRWAAVFIPVVVGIAGLTALAWTLLAGGGPPVAFWPRSRCWSWPARARSGWPRPSP